MSKEIEVEKAKNQKEEKLPMFQTYYQAFTRYEGGEWFTSGSASLDKNNVITQIRTCWSNAAEIKIIAFDMPF
jgi:hypothetical protein|tara:strand:- start:418 stop:636 length:219 start_codon:yes stop_codon:yes gene_type:complete